MFDTASTCTFSRYGHRSRRHRRLVRTRCVKSVPEFSQYVSPFLSQPFSCAIYSPPLSSALAFADSETLNNTTPGGCGMKKGRGERTVCSTFFMCVSICRCPHLFVFICYWAPIHVRLSSSQSPPPSWTFLTIDLEPRLDRDHPKPGRIIFIPMLM